MKILSYNVLCGGCEGHYWTDRCDDVVNIVRMRNPDVFGLQEAHEGWMKAFKNAMPEYCYVGVPRDNSGERSEYSPVFYKKDKFEVLDKGWFWISETPNKASYGWDAACMRICTYVKLKCIKCGKTFVAMNTHLDHVGVEARRNGVRMINEKAKEFDCPVFVTGDFNVHERTDCYVDMINANVFKDAKFLAPVLETNYTFHPYFHHDEPHQIIDFIFVSDGITVNNYHVIDDKVNGAYPSDHKPITADIEFN